MGLYAYSLKSRFKKPHERTSKINHKELTLFNLIKKGSKHGVIILVTLADYFGAVYWWTMCLSATNIPLLNILQTDINPEQNPLLRCPIRPLLPGDHAVCQDEKKRTFWPANPRNIWGTRTAKTATDKIGRLNLTDHKALGWLRNLVQGQARSGQRTWWFHLRLLTQIFKGFWIWIYNFKR